MMNIEKLNVSAVPNFLNLALCDYCHKNTEMKTFSGRTGLKYGLDLNSDSGFGCVFIENSEDEYQMKVITEVETYQGFNLPSSIKN